MQSELVRFKEALDRCVAGCQDQVKDAMPAEATDADVAKLRGRFESCAMGCVDTNVARMPSLTKKVREKLDLGAF